MPFHLAAFAANATTTTFGAAGGVTDADVPALQDNFLPASGVRLLAPQELRVLAAYAGGNGLQGSGSPGLAGAARIYTPTLQQLGAAYIRPTDSATSGVDVAWAPNDPNAALCVLQSPLRRVWISAGAT